MAKALSQRIATITLVSASMSLTSFAHSQSPSPESAETRQIMREMFSQIVFAKGNFDKGIFNVGLKGFRAIRQGDASKPDVTYYAAYRNLPGASHCEYSVSAKYNTEKYTCYFPPKQHSFNIVYSLASQICEGAPPENQRGGISSLASCKIAENKGNQLEISGGAINSRFHDNKDYPNSPTLTLSSSPIDDGLANSLLGDP